MEITIPDSNGSDHFSDMGTELVGSIPFENENAVTTASFFLGACSDLNNPGTDYTGAITQLVVMGTGATPFPYKFDASNVTYFRAPITNNPQEDNLNYSSSGGYRYVANERFVDHEGQWWVRIVGLEQNGTPVTDPAISAALATERGGLWIPIATPPENELPCNPLKGLPISERYTIPVVAWNTFTDTFADWPIDIADMCDSETMPREIHALGINPPNVDPHDLNYPRDTHNGVDLFVPNNLTNVEVKSISSGIVVGMGIDDQDTTTHSAWGSSKQTNDIGEEIPGYSVIIRYGHLYVLYGHLASVSDNIWVGAAVGVGTTIGILGKFNTRHLHIEIHSYGATIADGIGATKATLIGATGVLPVDESATDIIAPYHYDVTQFLPDPPGYSTTDNGGLHLRERVATAQLTQSGNEGSIAINFGSSCNFTYRTIYPNFTDPGAIIKEINGYRGFVGYWEDPERPKNRPLVSPLTPTQQP